MGRKTRESLGEATFGAASILPFGKIVGAAAGTLGKIAAKGGNRVFEVGAYNTIRGV